MNDGVIDDKAAHWWPFNPPTAVDDATANEWLNNIPVGPSENWAQLPVPISGTFVQVLTVRGHHVDPDWTRNFTVDGTQNDPDTGAPPLINVFDSNP